MSEQDGLIQMTLHASSRTTQYLIAAVDAIDEKLGAGAAKKNPGLVAELVRASAANFSSAVLCDRLAPAVDRIAIALDGVADAISRHSQE